MLYVNYLIKSRATFSKSDQPPKNQWTSLVFEQREEPDGKFVFKFFQAGVEMYTFQNSNPKEYSGMKAYASNPWHKVMPDTKIRNFRIETMIVSP